MCLGSYKTSFLIHFSCRRVVFVVVVVVVGVVAVDVILVLVSLVAQVVVVAVVVVPTTTYDVRRTTYDVYIYIMLRVCMCIIYIYREHESHYIINYFQAAIMQCTPLELLINSLREPNL